MENLNVAGNVIKVLSLKVDSKVISPKLVGKQSLYRIFLTVLLWLDRIDNVISEYEGGRLADLSVAGFSFVSTNLFIQLYISVYEFRFSSTMIIAVSSAYVNLSPVNGIDEILLYGTSTAFKVRFGCKTVCAKNSRLGKFLRSIVSLKDVGCKKLILFSPETTVVLLTFTDVLGFKIGIYHFLV